MLIGRRGYIYIGIGLNSTRSRVIGQFLPASQLLIGLESCGRVKEEWIKYEICWVIWVIDDKSGPYQFR